MSEFQKWTSQHRTIRASRDWNALLDHGLEKPASYIIRNNNGTIEAINGSTGKIDYNGSDAATVIQTALNALTPGRTWKERVVLKGNFSLSSAIKLSSYTVLDLSSAKLTLQENSTVVDDAAAISAFEQDYVDIIGGELDGGGYSPAGAKAAIELKRCGHSLVFNTKIYNFDISMGIWMGGVGNINNKVIACYIDTIKTNGIAQEDMRGGLIEGNYVTNCVIGIHITTSGATPCSQISRVTNNYLKDNSQGIALTRTQHVIVSDNVLNNNVLWGLRPEQCNIVNNIIYYDSNYGYGISLRAIRDSVIASNIIINAVNGIFLFDSDSEGSLRNDISHNQIIDIDGVLEYGILEYPNADYNRIEHNRIDPCALEVIHVAGANTVVRYNQGYVTENDGTAIIPANTKSYQVTFPMNVAPTVVKVTPSFDVSGRYWVDSLTYLGLIASGAYGPSGYYSRFTFNRTYSGLYSGIIYWNAEA